MSFHRNSDLFSDTTATFFYSRVRPFVLIRFETQTGYDMNLQLKYLHAVLHTTSAAL